MENDLRNLYDKERERLLSLYGTATCEGEFLTPVFGEGALLPKLMLIGEAPGSEESRQGHPFVGKAGKQLDALLSAASIARNEVYVTNAVKYRPTKQGVRGGVNRTPTKEEVLSSLWLLREEIRIVKPHVIATLGNTPLFAVSSLVSRKVGTIGEVHGRQFPMRTEYGGWILFPLYHPASTIYNQSLLPVLAQDVESLGKLLDLFDTEVK